MQIDFLTAPLSQSPETPAIVWDSRTASRSAFRGLLGAARAVLEREGVQGGDVVALIGDFDPESVAMLLALIERDAIIVPFTRGTKAHRLTVKRDIAQVEWVIETGAGEGPVTTRTAAEVTHPYFAQLRAAGTPGLVLFTSGTSGEPKAAVHDFSKLLKKFAGNQRQAVSTLNFLLFDHWGGLNTLLHVLSAGGTVIATADRSPDVICSLIARHRVELLPASPTFLNLLLLSEAYRRHDLSSLRVISYGTEPMPQATLDRLRAAFPSATLKQTYGLIELGVLPSRSRGNDSVWMKMGGNGYDLRIVDGILQIRADSAMLGYINAPSPFTEDGYFITGDMVEVDGDYFRVLGRRSELINVGGEKVYPQEVENAILRIPNVADVVVYGERNPLMGNIVCARVVQEEPEPKAAYVARIRTALQRQLAPYQRPVRITVTSDPAVTERLKKQRVGFQSE